MMPLKLRLFAALILSTILWSGVAFAVAAKLTGKLGPVTVRWSKFLHHHPDMTWSPNVGTYEFDKSEHLIVDNGSTVRFLVDVPPRFSRVRIRLLAGPDLVLIGDNQAVVNNSGPQDCEYDLRHLVSFPGGYRFTIRNLGANTTTLKRLVVTYYP